MSGYPPVPPPTPIVIHLLATLPSLAEDIGERVSIVRDATMPSLRVAHVGYTGAAATDWEAAPMFQVEVWTEDVLEAERIAWVIANTWTTATAQSVTDGVVHGRWVIQNPIPLPANDRDAENTGLARYSVTVAFRLTGVSNG